MQKRAVENYIEKNIYGPVGAENNIASKVTPPEEKRVS
jgi:hypothetical protein